MMANRGKSGLPLGTRGESLARSFLERKGFTFVERNFERSCGEIDLIMKDRDVLVFVEVRTRFGDGTTTPEDSIGKGKINQLIEMAELYQYLTHYYGPARIDAVCVQIRDDGRLDRIDHYENISYLA
ncbi:MAG: YraN family protein [Candidatus Dojkabacteria bacterium]|nr:YraN family protein [Candidatus Dojkabacteria bacterium]